MRALGQCDIAIAISSVEMRRIVAELQPQTRMVCLPATDFFRAPTSDLEHSATSYDLLFVGSRSDANIVGITWFLKVCFPLIVAVLPQVRLRIHGAITEMAALTQMVAQLPASWNITLTGPTAAMDGVYASARVVICPIQHGTGMKIKMIEAMSHGMAIVATSKAGEGIATDLGLAFADAPEAFAEACRLFIEDPRARARREQAARATFARDHENAQLVERLARVLGELGIG
jgi:glycosyltransferase involved in cell wall biosynthesis